jgi:hypothetical protein
MANGIPLQVNRISVDETGQGTIEVHFDTLADYKGAIARLHPGTVLFDEQQNAHYIQLAEPLLRPPSFFPSEAVLPIVQAQPAGDSVLQRMLFGNNYLGASAWAQVIAFEPPTQEGTPGNLRVQVDSAEEYADLLKFVDEPHGSSLSAYGDGQWYVHRTGGGELQPGEPFPQKVNFQLEWLRI